MSQTTIGIPSPAVEVSVGEPAPSNLKNVTCGTFKGSFEELRHLLSGKPLRRPARRHASPSRTPSGPTDAEAERQALMRRMPPRGRIEEIARKTPSPDPWLDDEYDWRP
jgi:hypothetical protein